MATILVVDDDSLMRECLCEVLAASGHQTRGAENGCACLKMLEHAQPELVLMDIFMPEMDGIATIMDIRQRFPDLAVIAMSGGTVLLDSSRYLRIANALGAGAILDKPVTTNALLQAVDEVLSQQLTAERA